MTARAPLIIVAVAALLATSTSLARSREAPMDAAAFARTLGELHDEVARSQPDDRHRIVAALPREWRVRAGGVEYAIHSASVLQADHGDRQALLDRIATLRSHALEAATSSRSSYADERRLLASVLESREFSRRSESEWGRQLVERIRAWLRDVFGSVLPDGAAVRGLVEVVAWAAALAALAALGYWLLRIRRSAGVTPGALGVRAADRLPSREWAARAKAAMDRGDTREAVRCAYLAAIYRVEEQGIWRVDDARTPREYERLLSRAAHEELRGAFRGLRRQFEETWYGARPVDSGELLSHLERFGCVAQQAAT